MTLPTESPPPDTTQEGWRSEARDVCAAMVRANGLNAPLASAVAYVTRALSELAQADARHVEDRKALNVAIAHLCEVLAFVSNVRSEDRCKAVDDAQEWYNSTRPKQQISWDTAPIFRVKMEQADLDGSFASDRVEAAESALVAMQRERDEVTRLLAEADAAHAGYSDLYAEQRTMVNRWREKALARHRSRHLPKPEVNEHGQVVNDPELHELHGIMKPRSRQP